MPPSPIPELIKNELKHLDEKLDAIIARQDKANGALGRHDEWIAAKTVEITQIQDRQDADDERHADLEERIDSHQRYIDERSGSWEEHKKMRDTLAAMQDYPLVREKVEQHQSALDHMKGARRLIADWAAIIAAVAAIALVFVKH